MNGIRILGSGLIVLAVLALPVGCTGKKDPPKGETKGKTEGEAKGNAKAGKPKEEEHHEHGEGPHGGTVADWGGGKFHVEFTVDHGKQEATVYVLGSDETTPAPVKAKDDQLLLTINEPSFQVVLKAMPQEKDTAGTSSRFVGKHENLGKEQEFAGTISAEVDGVPYTGDFKEEPAAKKKK